VSGDIFGIHNLRYQSANRARNLPPPPLFRSGMCLWSYFDRWAGWTPELNLPRSLSALECDAFFCSYCLHGTLIISTRKASCNLRKILVYFSTWVLSGAGSSGSESRSQIWCFGPRLVDENRDISRSRRS